MTVETKMNQARTKHRLSGLCQSTYECWPTVRSCFTLLLAYSAACGVTVSCHSTMHALGLRYTAQQRAQRNGGTHEHEAASGVALAVSSISFVFIIHANKKVYAIACSCSSRKSV